jgi:hypothetical protein
MSFRGGFLQGGSLYFFLYEHVTSRVPCCVRLSYLFSRNKISENRRSMMKVLCWDLRDRMRLKLVSSYSFIPFYICMTTTRRGVTVWRFSRDARRLPALAGVKWSLNICGVTLPLKHLNIVYNEYYLLKKPSENNLKMYIINACAKTHETI